MSLRELPPEQRVTGRRWRRLRYVPLVILVIAVLAAASTGYVVSHRIAAHAAAPAAVSPTRSATAALPASCHPAVTPPDSEPWIGARASSSESVWAAHPESGAAVVTGRDGWADWGDVQAQNFSQEVGRRLLSNAELAAWQAYFRGLRDRLASKGVRLYIVVTPAKYDIYPDKMPEWAQKLRGSVPLDQLLANSPDLPIIDVRQTLTKARASHDVFSRINSHWSLYGAYVAWKQIAGCIDDSAPQLDHRVSAPPISGVDVQTTSNEFAAYGVATATDWTVPRYAGALQPVDVTSASGTRTIDGSSSVPLTQLPVETQTQGAQSSASVLMLRDSFGDALSTLVDQSFATSWQVRHNLDMGPGAQPDVDALVAKDHPDIVIYQMAARYLIYPPA